MRAFARALDAFYRERARQVGVEDPRRGAVTVLQRFNSACQLSPHLHNLGFDGTFSIDVRRDRARFHPLDPPRDEEIAGLLQEIVLRVHRALSKTGLWPGPEADDEVQDPLSLSEPVAAACYAAAVQGRIAFGEENGRRPARLGATRVADHTSVARPLRARLDGFDLQCAVTVPVGDRDGLERLVRYLTRPPLSHDRLELTADGRVALRLKTPFSDGSTHILYSPHAFIERLCALVPRPRCHRTRYHGLLASASKYRRLVVPPPETPPEPPAQVPSPPVSEAGPERPPSTRLRFRRLVWAELLKKERST